MRTITLHAAAALAAALLNACGGGTSSTEAEVRLVNLTLTHPSLALVVDTNGAIGATAVNTASGYAGVDAGSLSLQVNDASANSALATATLGASKKNHYAIVAYEGGGVVQTATIAEDAGSPASGTAVISVLDAALAAGAVDVYVAPAASDITAITTPSFSFAASTSAQTSTSNVALAPGSYQVRVTGTGNPADVRLDIASFAVTNQQVATLVLTPTSGGTLVNGAVLVQQGAFTDGHNTKARLRLLAAVSGNALVSESAGTTPLLVNVPSPSVSGYVLVPGAAALGVTVNGAAVTAPTGPAAGSDATLVVRGDPGAATAALVADDNRAPASSSVLRLRLVNGLTGSTVSLSLAANFAAVATNVAPGAASPYAVLTASSSTRLDVVAAPSQKTIYTESALVIAGGSVYTLFILGDISAPVHLLNLDH